MAIKQQSTYEGYSGGKRYETSAYSADQAKRFLKKQVRKDRGLNDWAYVEVTDVKKKVASAKAEVPAITNR